MYTILEDLRYLITGNYIEKWCGTLDMIALLKHWINDNDLVANKRFYITVRQISSVDDWLFYQLKVSTSSSEHLSAYICICTREII